jgi:hypothetical protein
MPGRKLRRCWQPGTTVLASIVGGPAPDRHSDEMVTAAIVVGTATKMNSLQRNCGRENPEAIVMTEVCACERSPRYVNQGTLHVGMRRFRRFIRSLLDINHSWRAAWTCVAEEVHRRPCGLRVGGRSTSRFARCEDSDL